MTRAMVVNAAQLATYSQSKQFILGTGDSLELIEDFIATYILNYIYSIYIIIN
jgi:hypothetical protein